jgi:hypothetical protein
LGLKTETSFSMFSNLQTEGKLSNHLIIGRNLGLTNFQDDLVKILHSSDPELHKLAARGYLLPYFEMRSYISRKAKLGADDIELSYVRGGVRRSVEKAGSDPALSRPYSLFLRKFFRFRPVRPEGMNTCQH